MALNTGTQYRLPPWLRFGLVSVLANTSVRDNEVQIGRLVPWHVQIVGDGERLLLRDLVSATADSPWMTNQLRRFVLDSESALLVHMLLFGSEDPAVGDRVTDYAERVRTGEDPLRAFEAVFGEPAQLENAFRQYLARRLLTYRRAKIDLRVERDKLPVRQMTAAEGAVVVAALHAASDLQARAATEIDAIGDLPASGLDLKAILADEQLLKTRRSQDGAVSVSRASAQVMSAYEAAVAAGSSNYYSYYRLASELASGSPSAENARRAGELMARSIALNPDYPAAYLVLARLETLQGQHENAIRLVNQAVAADPASLITRLSAADVYRELERWAEAVMSARVAKSLANDDDERAAAADRFDSILKDAQASVARLPPPLPNPPDAIRAGGAIAPPRRIKEIRPVPTALSRAAEAQGLMIFEVVVGSDGHVLDVRVLRSVPFLDVVAAEAVRQWEYEPLLVNDKPTPVILMITMNFAK